MLGKLIPKAQISTQSPSRQGNIKFIHQTIIFFSLKESHPKFAALVSTLQEKEEEEKESKPIVMPLSYGL